MNHIFEMSSGLGAQNNLVTVSIVGGVCRESFGVGINVTGEIDVDDRIIECPCCPCSSGVNAGDITVNVTGVGAGDTLFFEEACA